MGWRGAEVGVAAPRQGQSVDDIPKEVLSDCAHLVKANSIQGCKLSSVTVVYTPWSNLRKTPDMDVGQIGFHRSKDVRSVTVERRAAEQLRRLERTRVERFPDLAAERECRDREERGRRRMELQEQMSGWECLHWEQREELRRKKEMEELRSYSSLMKAENMSSNQDGNDSDDFM
ncbi:coiled-coil domain-containing protein 25 isoform X3 [Pyrgilauda ruficollis]|uniref:coiled-coil domain-containing protein 25 isoform X3 n=1 Tax=Pyrgilauda ruficollis TaxID=221976 RepID=UPI001B86AB8D|nr:coiled-coil domain-containing protein 25 isoform X3 [Pyrgilauda ruficollis]